MVSSSANVFCINTVQYTLTTNFFVASGYVMCVYILRHQNVLGIFLPVSSFNKYHRRVYKQARAAELKKASNRTLTLVNGVRRIITNGPKWVRYTVYCTTIDKNGNRQSELIWVRENKRERNRE